MTYPSIAYKAAAVSSPPLNCSLHVVHLRSDKFFPPLVRPLFDFRFRGNASFTFFKHPRLTTCVQIAVSFFLCRAPPLLTFRSAPSVLVPPQRVPDDCDLNLPSFSQTFLPTRASPFHIIGLGVLLYFANFVALLSHVPPISSFSCTRASISSHFRRVFPRP